MTDTQLAEHLRTQRESGTTDFDDCLQVWERFWNAHDRALYLEVEFNFAHMNRERFEQWVRARTKE